MGAIEGARKVISLRGFENPLGRTTIMTGETQIAEERF